MPPVPDKTTITPASFIINLDLKRTSNSTTIVSSSSSSSSASINRSSFASDLHDRDSSVSESHQHLAARVSRSNSLIGLDLDPDECFTARKPNGHKCVQNEGRKSEIKGDISTDSTPVSHSLANKDCQCKRVKDSEKGSKRSVVPVISVAIKSSSPRLETLKKDSVMSCLSDKAASPGTPAYQFPSVGVSMQKGWNSERMALPLKGSNRIGPALLPLKNVKTLPSKWEDAERWIFSPSYGESSYSYRQPVHQNLYQKNPKAKSGPLGPPGSAYYSMYAQGIQISDRRSVGDQMGNSPFSSGLMGTKRLSTSYDDLGKNSPASEEPWMPRSVSLRGCSVELTGQSSLPSSQVLTDEKEDKMNDTATYLSCPVSRRDISIDMSPSVSKNSSIRRITSSHCDEQAHSSFSKMRDVEMDEKKITIGSLKNIHRGNPSSRSASRVNDCKKNTIGSQSSSWSCKDTATGLGKSTRDEARIIVWENLQKAKADAAIQKLEMKLEKKKASSMDKIMKKLKSSQKKAHEMRMYMASNQQDQATKSSSGRRKSSTCKVRQKSSLTGCFTCHPFELP